MMNDDSKPEDWYRGKEYEELQAKYTADFYTMLFSHPAVEAITWWDFQDNDWRAAPAGLVTEEVHRKPAYHALRKLIRCKIGGVMNLEKPMAKEYIAVTSTMVTIRLR